MMRRLTIVDKLFIFIYIFAPMPSTSHARNRLLKAMKSQLQILFAFSIIFFNCRCTPAQQLSLNDLDVKSLVIQWNEGHTLHTVESLANLYVDTVYYNGSVIHRERCITKKRIQLKKEQGSKQSINHDLILTAYSQGFIRCDFVKTITDKNKSVEVDAFLILKKIGNTYRIIAESDRISDRRQQIPFDLGNKVTIRIERDSLAHDPNSNIAVTTSNDTGVSFLTWILAIGIMGISIVLIKQRYLTRSSEVIADRETSSIKKNVDTEKGLQFEQYIAQQFALNKKHFSLLEWRGDKFYNGIYARSSHNPDLEYEFKFNGVVRQFAVECKYRSRYLSGTVEIMNERNYKNYKNFHDAKMPVYIALGVGGTPNNPAQLYLIPFERVQLTMAEIDLQHYRKNGPFFYNLQQDRLT